VSERLLDRCDLLGRAQILARSGTGCRQSEELFAVSDPGTFGHKAVPARDPFLDLLVSDSWSARLRLGGLMPRALRRSIIVTIVHLSADSYEITAGTRDIAEDIRCWLIETFFPRRRPHAPRHQPDLPSFKVSGLIQRLPHTREAEFGFGGRTLRLPFGVFLLRAFQ